ncbi:MAG: O-antigen ligase family protein [Candidatus Hydrogenedens sp.]|nr:O-antigen ligase family protein [Candidatus Hydrogenedens sp.]
MTVTEHDSTVSLVPASIWGAVLCLTAAAWSFRTTSFMEAKELCLLLGVLFAAPIQWKTGILRAPAQPFLFPLLAGLIFWAVTGFFVAKVPGFVVENLVRWQLYLVALWLATAAFSVPGGRLFLYGSLLYSALLVALLALMQYGGLLTFLFPVFPGYSQPAYSVFGNQNLLGGYMAMALILLPVLHRLDPPRKISTLLLRVIAWLILLAALIISGTRSAWLAALVGGAVWVFLTVLRHFKKQKEDDTVKALPFPGKRLLRSVATVGTLLLLLWGGVLFNDRIRSSFSEKDVGGPARLWFWAGAERMIGDHPWLGVGLGNYPRWSSVYQGKALWEQGGERYFRNELHTDHAHSEPLEWLAETGFAGILFWLLFLILTLRQRPAALPVLACMGAFALVNNFTHSPPHTLAFLLLALDPNGTEEEERASSSRPRVLMALPLSALCYLLVIGVPSFLKCRAEDRMEAGLAAEEACAAAFYWPWHGPALDESCAAAFMREGQYERAMDHLISAARRLDTHSVHQLILYCMEGLGDEEMFYATARKCLYRWPDDVHAWDILLQYCPEEERELWESHRLNFMRTKPKEKGEAER